jgi:hypothetical protein
MIVIQMPIVSTLMEVIHVHVETVILETDDPVPVGSNFIP